MQTRKRNIDSVLNLVNPKRKKLLTTSPNKKVQEKQSKTKQVADLKKEIHVTSVNKSKSSEPEKDGDVKKDNKEKEKKEKGSNIEVENPHAQVVDKPFKKRPLIDEKEGINNTDLSEVKVIEIVIQIQNETNNESKLPTVSLCKPEQDFESKETIHDDKEFIDVIGISSENAGNKTIKETSIAGVDKITEMKKEEIIGEINQDIYWDVESGIKVETTRDSVKDTPDEVADNDDFIILDAVAIDDDLDKDYVASKKEPIHENMVEQSSNTTTRIISVQTGNVKPDTKDGETETPVTKPRFRCQYCNKYFHTTDILKEHMMIHKGDLPFICDQCGMRFRQNSILKRHMVTHMEDCDRPYACPICKKTFKRKSDVDLHQVVHRDAKPFTCLICLQKFKREVSLLNHMKVHKFGKTFVCDQCGMSFGYRSTLEGHRKTHSDTKAFECKICGKGFHSKQSFNDHMLRHDKIKEVVCHVCNKRYYNSKELGKHMRFHLTVTAHQCELCKMYFNDTHSLRIHNVKTHGDVYNCDFCDKTFMCRRAVKSHIFREHRELRNARKPKMPMREKANFKHVLCDFCGKELSNKYRLKKHLIAKHSGKKIVRRPPDPSRVPQKLFPSGMKVLCTVCNKVMFNKYKLFTHMRKIHDIPITDIKDIKLVRLEGETKVMKNKPTEKMMKKVKLDKDTDCQPTSIELDGQPIIIRPESARTVRLVDQVSRPGKNTIHYLDAHGNIIYTDVSSDKQVINDYLVCDIENGQMKQRFVECEIDGEKITNYSIDDSKELNNEGLKNNIVDYAAKTAKIIDEAKDIPIVVENDDGRWLNENNEEVIILNKPSSEIIESSAGFNKSSDITYIVQQATDRIAAHEKSVDTKTVMNLGSNDTIENDLRLIVGDSMNDNVVNPTEGIQYVIDDGSMNSGEIGYLVKEGLNDILNDDVVLENYDDNQEQRIIIIDENGEEQVLSTGSNDFIKITYDPETGLYTYFTEEVEVKQGVINNDENNSIADASFSKVIVKEEDQQISEDRYDAEVVSNDFVKGSVNENKYDIMSNQDEKAGVICNEVVKGSVNENDYILSNQNENAGVKGNEVVKGSLNENNYDILSIKNENAGVTSNEVVKGSVNEDHYQIILDQNEEQVNELEDKISQENQLTLQKVDNQTSINLPSKSVVSSSTVLQSDYNKTQHEDTVSKSNNMEVWKSVSRSDTFNIEGQNDQTQNTDGLITGVLSLTKSQEESTIAEIGDGTSGNKTLFLPKSEEGQRIEIQTSNVIPSELVSSYQPSSLHHLQSYESSVYTPSILNTTDALRLYMEKQTVDVIQVSEQAHMTVSDSSSDVFGEIDQGVEVLEQTHEPLTADFSRYTDPKSIPVDVSKSDEDTVADSENNIAYIEDQTNNQYYLPVVTGSANLIDADTSNKKSFVQLENMLKSGIKDASNTEEYTNFLDRMINHLQSAKDSAVGKPCSDN